ncbi:MAG: FAD binding domain-containing protein [Deltaproteobacteria bacterium]|nr:FAD binding domain-containing protein [Deltaproteobacteria bacterium]
MMRPKATYVRPGTLTEAVDLLQDLDDRCKLLAGGTDVATELRSGAIRGRCLVDLSALPELKGIHEAEEELVIGSGVTLSEIASSAGVARGAPALAKAAAVFGSRQIRNMATIGGNICRASPAGDTLPPLYVQDAELELTSSSKTRRVSIRDFIQGPGRIDLKAGEILKCIRLKKAADFTMHRFDKIGNRKALAVSIVNLAGLVALSPDGIIQRIRLAWGSVAPTVVRSSRVEAFLTGKPLRMETLDQAYPLVQDAISPIDDARASAAYRRRVAVGLLFRLTTQQESPDSIMDIA